MADPHVLSRDAVKQIAKQVGFAESLRRNERPHRRNHVTGGEPGMFLAKVPLSGIPARSGLTPGTVTVDIFKLDDSGNLEDADFDQEIRNIYPLSVAFDPNFPYFQVFQDNNGNWFNESPQLAATPIGVPFKNVSGEIMPPGAVMYAPDSINIGGIPHIEGQKPFSQFDRFWLINGQTAVAPNGTGLGSWLGDLTGFVAIASGTPGTAQSWGPRPGSWLLWPERLGFTPLRNGTYTINGQLCGYFKQHQVLEVYGKYEEELKPPVTGEAGNKAKFKIYYRNENRILHPAGWDHIDVYDFFLNRGEKIRKGTKGSATWKTSVWESGFSMCDPDNTNESGTSAILAAFAMPDPVLVQPKSAVEPSDSALLQPVITP